MTETPAPSDSIRELQALLVDLGREPLDLLARLRELREAATADGTLARDLDRAELAFLDARLDDRRVRSLIESTVAVARRAAMRVEQRALAAEPDADPAVLFDLAELSAAYRAEELASDVAAVRREIARRIEFLTGVDEALRLEAGERCAALATEEEDLSLARKILLLEETRAVLQAITRRFEDRAIRKLSRRLENQACDRVLAARMERVLTVPGASILENTSLALLIVVFALLAIEAVIGERKWIFVLDASICTFFILEFLLKLVLAPARVSWFLRNALTDLLPAIPAAMFFFTQLDRSAPVVLVRAFRFFRIVTFARYVQALRPILGVLRLVLFLARGTDALVRRFSKILNRDFVFFEQEVVKLAPSPGPDERSVLFRALRREQVILTELGPEEAAPELVERARVLAIRFETASWSRATTKASTARGIVAREVPVEHAIEFLWKLHPDDLGAWIARSDVLALDRVVRVINAPIIRSLPVVRSIASPERLPTPDERVVELGRRVALTLERSRDRVLYLADLHGIVTGPQILDRVATTMVNATKRPAVRLLLFGGLFTIVRLLFPASSPLGGFVAKFVATPLVVLGSVCLVLLALGRWLKSLAGQASDQFKLTSEAHFIGQLELAKRREQDGDLAYLAKRVFRWDLEEFVAAGHLSAALELRRSGIRREALALPQMLESEIRRVALLYLHYLDGAVLHETDVKTTEQLLANLSIENIRHGHVGWTRRDRRRLKKLSLTDGGVFGGPFVWFRFITESAAVEAARRVIDYNRYCLTTAQHRVASESQRLAFAQWLRRRRRPEARQDAPHGSDQRTYATTEFCALDFLSSDLEREDYLERMFGARVVRLMRRDRQAMIREIFGSRPLHRLPKSKRTFNAYSFYRRRLSRGRMFLLPLHAVVLLWGRVRMGVSKTVQIVAEILWPERAAMSRGDGRATFAVALRKIHRMKAPGLLESIRLRTTFDPVYCGAPPGWSLGQGFDERSELERDLDFLMLREQDRESMRSTAARNLRHVEELHRIVQRFPGAFGDDADPESRRLGERAVTIAYMTDRNGLRTMFRAEDWFEAALQRMENPETRLRTRLVRRFGGWVARGLRRHPVDRWLATHFPDRRVSRRGHRNFVRAWYGGDEQLKRTVKWWSSLSAGVRTGDLALATARDIYSACDDVSRDLVALRAIQTLSVLDVRNYRRLVFEVGDYASDGEDPELAVALP